MHKQFNNSKKAFGIRAGTRLCAVSITCLVLCACDSHDTADNSVSDSVSSGDNGAMTSGALDDKETRTIDKNNLAVLALTVNEAQVVVKTPRGDMVLVKKGDMVPGFSAKLVDVLPDRAVFEEIVTYNNDKVKEIVWVYPAVNGVSRIQRLSKRDSSAPVYPAPEIIIPKTDSKDDSVQ